MGAGCRAAVLLAGMIACGPSEEPDRSQLAGTWTLTSLVYTSARDPARHHDLVADGASGRLVMEEDGRWSMTLATPEAGVDFASGVVRDDHDTLRLIDRHDPDDRSLRVEFAARRLVLVSDSVEYPFEDRLEPARVRATFEHLAP